MRINNTDSIESESYSNKLLIVLIAVCSVSLYLIKGLGKGDRVIEIMGMSLIIFFLLLYTIYYKGAIRFKRQFSVAVILLLVFLLGSDISCQYFNGQSISLTMYQQRKLYYILFYFLIPFLAPKPEWIKNFIIYMALVGSIIYILQYFAFPTKITEAQMFRDRGTIRIFLPGAAFSQLGYFLCINEIFLNYKRKYAIVGGILFSMIILTGFRSLVALYVLIPAIYLLISKHIKNRLLILSLAVLICISAFFAFQSIIQAMNKSAKRESSQGADYVRVRAAAFYLHDCTQNKVSLIFGNGHPNSGSAYGERIVSYMVSMGFYLSDIGVIGTLYKYGLIFTLIMLFLLIRLITIKVPPELNFIKLYVWMQLLLIFNTVPFYDDSAGLIVLVFMFYLIECHYNGVGEVKVAGEAAEGDSSERLRLAGGPSEAGSLVRKT